jgi:D-alanyl-D-alanine carboxypeptidase/D-alanyl-D-alanine-endopeptidase (penicillin-binding protein 4)
MLALTLAAASPVVAQQQTLQQRVEARLSEAGPGTRFGIVVATEDGQELIAISPDDRFIPASNTKMFTTAAAFATLPGVEQPDAAGGASVRLDGGGEARPRRHPERPWRRPTVRCCRLPDQLSRFAGRCGRGQDRLVHDVIGDDSLFRTSVGARG